jgi:hypothetical protein
LRLHAQLRPCMKEEWDSGIPSLAQDVSATRLLVTQIGCK